MVEHPARDYGLRGIGDETEAFQSAIDRLSAQGNAVLLLERGVTYSVRTLRISAGVAIRGDRSCLQAWPSAGPERGALLRVCRGGALTLEDLALRGHRLIFGKENGHLRLRHVLLAPSSGPPAADGAALSFSEDAQFSAIACRAEYGSGEGLTCVLQDRARFTWTGGELLLDTCSIFDHAEAAIDVEAFEVRGRPGLVAGRTSGPLWAALCGDKEHFKQIRDNPVYAEEVERWRAHNRTQDGRLNLRVRGSLHTLRASRCVLHVYGGFTLEVNDSVLQLIRAYDESRVTMRGGEMERVEAYGLSTSRYEDVVLIARGREDPWHPVTSYLQGYHVLECSRQYNDLLPRIEFQGGRIVFAGDDCLNGLPESRALQLMEVVHDHESVFAGYENMARFAPETKPLGERLSEIRGSAGAVHDEGTRPERPFDFRNVSFRWRGGYDAASSYLPGQVVAHENLLYVCNAPCKGIVPNRVFDAWQVFLVAFRNEAGYLQAARRVCGDAGWHWQKRQALGPWHGFHLRERGNPVVTYQVHLILKETTIIRHANTWSWARSPRIPVGDAAYEYVLSCLVPNVWYNTENNQVECGDVTLEVRGTDAMPAIGLSLGPNRESPMRSVFRRVRIRGCGVPVCLRIDRAPLRDDNRVLLQEVTAEGEAVARSGMHNASEGDLRMQFEFIGAEPEEWKGIEAYLAHFLDAESDPNPVRSALPEPCNRRKQMLDLRSRI